jgi:FMN phosphatase YigB (HAD superfamily)
VTAHLDAWPAGVEPPSAGHLDVLLDVDGVLYPLPELFTPYAAERLGRTLELDTTNWEFYADWGLGYDDFVDLLGRGVRERRLWWTGTPYPDVVDAVRALRAPGHRIHIVTARNVRGIEAHAFDATVHWLAAHDIEVETINLAQDKTVVLERLGLDPRSTLAIDDGPHYIASFAERGVYGVVVDRWGSYRGDHPTAPDLAAVAALVASWT